MTSRRRGTFGAIVGLISSLLAVSTKKQPLARPKYHRASGAPAEPTATRATGSIRTSGYADAPVTASNNTQDLEPSLYTALKPSYAPKLDGDADPGEVIWTWVPYAELDGRGKDRPVLIIARLPNGDVSGCALSTKQHSGFIPVGSGAWDSESRTSYLNPDRLLRVPQSAMRREGHILSREVFTAVSTRLSQLYGFSR